MMPQPCIADAEFCDAANGKFESIVTDAAVAPNVSNAKTADIAKFQEMEPESPDLFAGKVLSSG